VTQTTPRGGSPTDEATQQLPTAQGQRQATPRLPRPLDPTPPAADSTEVLSIHDLLDGPSEPVAEAPVDTVPAAETPVAEAAPALVPLPDEAVEPAPTPTPAAAPRPAAAATPVAAPAATPVGSRMRSDAAAAWASTRREVQAWLARGDNALLVATVAVALLLLAVVAFVG
jgi:hypothetical protein